MKFTNRLDVETAADLAFFEFYRLVGSVHEDVKAIDNGNALADAIVAVPMPVTIQTQTIGTSETTVIKVKGKKK